MERKNLKTNEGVGACSAVALLLLFLTYPLFPSCTPAEPTASEGGGQVSSDSRLERTVIIDVPDGNAEVYREGRLMGVTPLQLKEKVGQHVELVLKRPGHNDRHVSFTINEDTKAYSFPMSEKE